MDLIGKNKDFMAIWNYSNQSSDGEDEEHANISLIATKSSSMHLDDTPNDDGDKDEVFLTYHHLSHELLYLV